MLYTNISTVFITIKEGATHSTGKAKHGQKLFRRNSKRLRTMWMGMVTSVLM
jgi:hypothetical protein